MSIDFSTLIWIFFALMVLQPLLMGRWFGMKRSQAIRAIEQRHGSRVITMIHRQEKRSLFGFSVSRHIDLEDAQTIIAAIKETPPDRPIDLVLHTPGGLVLAAMQIARAVEAHPAKVSVYVPVYAMSGGTLIALAADEIVMDANAVLGPVDPQLGDMPAASILKAVELKGPKNVGDEFLMLADMANKARNQVGSFVAQVLMKQMPEKQSVQVATILTEGRWTHDFPITVQAARQLGLKVSTEMPLPIYELMDLYPQGGGIRPSVWYVPRRRTPPGPGAPQTPAPRPEGKGPPS